MLQIFLIFFAAISLSRLYLWRRRKTRSKKFLKKIYVPCSISAPSLVSMAKDKNSRPKGRI